MRTKLPSLVLALAFAPSGASAWEPPAITPQEAFSTAHAAFVGRIVGLQEISRSGVRCAGAARFEVTMPLLRCPVPEGGTIVLTHASLSRGATEMEAELGLSRTYLVVLCQSDLLGPAGAFDSDLAGGVDAAFLAPEAGSSEALPDPLSLSSIYGRGGSVTLTAAELRALAAQREAQLASAPAAR